MKKLHYLLLFLSVFGLNGCRKSSKSNDPVPKSLINTSTPAPKTQVNVYLAGIENGVAKYWKNGAPVNLSNGIARSIFVSGSDVYTVGTISYQETAGYWKNGSRVDLAVGATAISIYVSGNDVYLAGTASLSQGGYATYWKNGSAGNLTKVPDPIVTPSSVTRASSIFVSGSDIYVAGWVQIPRNRTVSSIATYWKNGNPVNLTNAHNYYAKSIFVSGNDVYVAGGVGYWKNGNPIALINGTGYSSIFVSGNDVYAAGYETVLISGVYYQIAKYWKNGIPVNLTNGAVNASANSIFVSGNDVYIAGNEGAVAKYWKNGIPVNLTDGTSPASANSIFISAQ